MLPSALNDVIETLGRLPGVGPRTAERYAYYLLKTDESISLNIAKSLAKLHSEVKTCPITFALIDSENTVSPLYDDPSRDKDTILVVEEPLDIYAIEHTKSYHGTYHVLGGAISPMDGITADQLHIKELIDRVEKDNATEIIIATNLASKANQPQYFSKSSYMKNTQICRSLVLHAASHSASRSNMPTRLR